VDVTINQIFSSLGLIFNSSDIVYELPLHRASAAGRTRAVLGRATGDKCVASCPKHMAAVGSVRLACPACDSDGRLSCPILLVIFRCPMETSLASTKSVESTEIATTADHVVFVIVMALDQLAAHLLTNPVEQVEGQPWVPDGSTVGPRFLGGNRGSPHKNRQPWVPATSFLFCVRWATRPNCQPLTPSHLESDGGPTASMPSAGRPHCILPARNLETLTIF